LLNVLNRPGGGGGQLARAPIITAYEAWANPADHKTKTDAQWSSSYVG